MEEEMTCPSILFWFRESNKANTFKSTYQIMEELAGKWEQLTDIQQANSLPVCAEMYR